MKRTSVAALVVAALAAIATSPAETGSGVRASAYEDGPPATLTSSPTTWRIRFDLELPGDFVPTQADTSIYVDVDATQVDPTGAVETSLGDCDGSNDLYTQRITGGEQFGTSSPGVFDQCGIGTTCTVELCFTAAAADVAQAPIGWSVDAIAEYVDDPDADPVSWEDGTLTITISEQ